VKNRYDVIVHFTGLHKFVDTYTKGICVPMTSDGKAKMYYVCAMLNYILIDNYDRFGIEHIFGIDKSMLEIFFQDYALEKQSEGSSKSNQTIEKCVFAITGFFRKLCRSHEGHMKISSKDLYNEKTVFSKRGKAQKENYSKFQCTHNANRKNDAEGYSDKSLSSHRKSSISSYAGDCVRCLPASIRGLASRRGVQRASGVQSVGFGADYHRHRRHGEKG
jgi:hypothetical protein